MALKKSSEERPSASNNSNVSNKANDVFGELAKRRERGEINKTVTVSFRLVDSERERIEEILRKNGYNNLASGAKDALYKLVRQLEK
jgi:hypothetical protein